MIIFSTHLNSFCPFSHSPPWQVCPVSHPPTLEREHFPPTVLWNPHCRPLGTPACGLPPPASPGCGAFTHAMSCGAAVGGAPAPPGTLSPSASGPPGPALRAGPQHPALRSSWTLLCGPHASPLAGGLPRGSGRPGLLRAAGAAEGPGAAARPHGPALPGRTDPAGGLTHRSGARPQTDKGRRRAHSSAGASGLNYNSQEAAREPARRVPGRGRPGFSEHCGKRSSAGCPAARPLKIPTGGALRRIPFGLSAEGTCPST